MTAQTTGKDVEVAVLFADVVGSTRLYQRMGEQRARDMVALCIDVMRSATEQYRGTVIKTMGDEIMATFPSADEALNAAAQMQKESGASARAGRVPSRPGRPSRHVYSAARSRSLIEVLARVCASTRLTMTAQASAQRLSAEGSVPGTTTEPAGIRPRRICPLARS